MLGDSITAGGFWNELLPSQQVRNRGIDGDTTEGVLKRLDQVLPGRPAKVFLLIGTNDVSLGTPIRKIAHNVERIIDAIQSNSPETRVYLESVFPRTPKMANRLRQLNTLYADLALRRDLTYLDFWPILADEKGAIRSEFSNDNLHLTGAGYIAWVQQLRACL